MVLWSSFTCNLSSFKCELNGSSHSGRPGLCTYITVLVSCPSLGQNTHHSQEEAVLGMTSWLVAEASLPEGMAAGKQNSKVA